MPRLALFVVLALVACEGRDESASRVRPRTPGPRVSMMALHATGGVPPGWQLTPPAGDVGTGRRLFVDFGCDSCHRVEGEAFAAKAGATGVGPDLTGMGAHHPPAYFAEAIMNPDAVLVDEPGFVGPDGHSVMPDYPEMTIGQLADLVAYLTSLRRGGAHAVQAMASAPAGDVVLAAPPPLQAKVFFSQSYDVKPGQRGPFQEWFRTSGAKRFLAIDGLLGIDTYLDGTRPRNLYTTIWGFRDGAALQRFMDDPAGQAVGLEFDGFIGDHEHQTQTSPPIYRVPSLSVPPVPSAKAFVFQTYDVLPGKLQAFEEWFATTGAKQLLAFDGMVSIETYVDATRRGQPYTTILGFVDGRAVDRYMLDRTAWEVGVALDGFTSEHDHLVKMSTPVNRVDDLSAP